MWESIKKWFFLSFELGKIKITFSVTITTAIGYLLAPEPRDSYPLWPIMGILLIGLSSAALNQLQDRELDKKMNRTKHRPLPSGRVTPRQVGILVGIYLFAGMFILITKTNITATLLGLSAYIWYNGFYTYLKRVSSIAVIPGSVIGGVPPAVGWAAAGGYILDPLIIAVCMFMFIWQIPHFWLLLFLYGDDYQRAGLPSLIHKISAKNLRFLTFGGIVVTIISALLIPFAASVNTYFLYLILSIFSLVLIYLSFNLVRPSVKMNYKKTFIAINIYSVFVLITIFIDSQIGWK